MSKLLIGESLRYGQADTPTREGEVINYLEEIYNIPTPYVGMRVYCKQTGKAYTITSLAGEIIGGEEVFDKVGTFEAEVKEVAWVNVGNVSNMNDFTEAGVYELKGERTRDDDNLPFGNTGGSHTFHARLEVLDSSIAPKGQPDDICITQKLTLSNRVAGDGDVYIRTGRGANKQSITWETWGKLQQNIEVGSVDTLDNLIDNGIYSGVLNGTGETFVLVVINNYALAEQYGIQRSVSQFKYSVGPTGVVSFGRRVKKGDGVFPDTWEILNSAEIYKYVDDAMLDAMEYTDNALKNIAGVTPDTLIFLEQVAAWAKNHEELYQFLKSTVELNSQAIEDEKTRAENAEKGIKGKAVDVETLNASVLKDKVSVYFRNLNGVQSEFPIPSATTTAAGVMSAVDKANLDKAVLDISNLTDTIENAESDISDISNRVENLEKGGTGGGGSVDLSDYYTKEEIDNKPFVTTEPTTEELPDVPEYITRTDLDNAIAEAITNTINTPV